MFGRKATAEDVMKLFAQLSDDEKAKVLDGLKKPETEDEAQIAEAEKHIEEKGEENGTKDQTEKDIASRNRKGRRRQTKPTRRPPKKFPQRKMRRRQRTARKLSPSSQSAYPPSKRR